MRTRLVITLLAALAAVATTGPAAATEPVHGTFWYIIDNVTAVDADAEALVWVTLPPAWDGQEVTLGAFDPAPVAILEDPSSGNRIVEWRLRPEPFAAGDAIEDDVVLSRVWGKKRVDRTHLNVLLHRVRKDLSRIGLDGPALIVPGERVAGLDLNPRKR